MNPQAEATSSRAARTAARLREAGIDAFAELGWQGTRVEDVVKRAGVSHGTFYTYYDNKAALLADLVRVSQVEFAALAAAPWGADDVRGALEGILAGFLERYREDAAIMKAWLQAAREDRSFSDLYLSSRALFVDRVSENVAAVLAVSGKERTPPAPTVASTLVAMVEHFAYCWLVLGEEHEPDDALESIVLVWGSTLNALAGFELVELP